MQNTKPKTTKTKVADLKFLRLPIDDLTKSILDDLKNQNPYFSDLDCIRWILGKYYNEFVKK
jgi:hypothetical protein